MRSYILIGASGFIGSAIRESINFNKNGINFINIDKVGPSTVSKGPDTWHIFDINDGLFYIYNKEYHS